MNDNTLLEYYLSLQGPEAGKWNLSPVSLYLEHEVRRYFQSNVRLKSGMRVCNVGIGTGEWDDFLGYELCEYGHLTSIDIDKKICDLFKYRQQRVGHINPSEVKCCDFSNNPIDDSSFDIITIIGSTMMEIGNYKDTFSQCNRLLKDGGILFYMDFEKYHKASKFQDISVDLKLDIVDIKTFKKYENLEFYIYQARKRES